MTAPHPEAYSFETDLTLDQMLAALNQRGTLAWRLHDSDRDGDLIAAGLPDGLTDLRIIPHQGKYVLDLGWIATLPGVIARADLDQLVQRDVLPVVGARAVTARDAWD